MIIQAIGKSTNSLANFSLHWVLRFDAGTDALWIRIFVSALQFSHPDHTHTRMSLPRLITIKPIFPKRKKYSSVHDTCYYDLLPKTSGFLQRTKTEKKTFFRI